MIVAGTRVVRSLGGGTARRYTRIIIYHGIWSRAHKRGPNIDVLLIIKVQTKKIKINPN